MKTLLKAWNWIFFPSMVDMHQNQDESTHLCPYCEHIPFMVRSVLETHLLTPPVLFNSGVDVFVKSMGPIKKILGQDDGSLESAYLEARKAQKDFRRKLRARGEEVLGQFMGRGLQLWAVLGSLTTFMMPSSI
jgi:predicted nucleotide-binding protein (sugar kinase/HSP70/actin superfamily)